MKLYHYTRFEQALLIREQGVIQTTESNVSLKPHAGPDVVWLTTLDSWEVQEWMWHMEDKIGVRLIVEVPDDEVYRWEHFAIRHNMRKKLIEAMKGSDPNWPNWFVLPRPITAGEIIGYEVNPNGVPVRVNEKTGRTALLDLDLSELTPM